MKVLQSDAEILAWLNIRKKQLTAGKPVPISDAPWGRNDTFSNGGMKFEWPVASIQFYDAEGTANVLGGDPDEKKFAAQVIMKEGSRLLWVRTGHEALLAEIDHDFRIFNVTIGD